MLMCDIPLLVYPTLRVMYPIIWRKDYHRSSYPEKVLSVSGIHHTVILFTAMVLSFFPHVISYPVILGVVSVLTCVYISGALPCLLYLKHVPEGDPGWLRVLAVVILCVTLIVSLLTYSVFLWYHRIYY